MQRSLAVLLALLAAAANGATIRLVPAEKPVPATVRLLFRRVDAPQPVVSRDVVVGTIASVDLGSGTWQVEVDSPGAWAERRTFAAADEVALTVWPTGRLRGTFRGDPPATLRAAFDSHAALRGATGPSGEVACTIDAREWRCELPAGLRQVRLTSAGSAPLFLWDRRIDAQRDSDAGEITLVAGAAISGHVDADQPRDPAGRPFDFSTARVALTPVGAARATMSLAPDKHGSFVFPGVTPGQYILQVSAPNAISTPVQVRVLPRLTAELREPLRLARPRRLTIDVVPSTPPQGGRWLIRAFAARNGSAQHSEVIAEGPAAVDGRWQQTLAPGAYSIDVATPGGASWARADVNVVAADERLPIVVPLLHISGSAKLGERPLSDATLTFVQKGRVVVRTNGEGAFDAFVSGSAEEPWNVIVESEKPSLRTELNAVRPRLRDGDAVFELDVPRTMISGRCVRAADGAPVPHAIVSVFSDGGRFQQASAENDGTFEVLGLPPGAYRITADAFLLESAPREIKLTEEPLSELTLELRPQTEFKGRVFAPNRSPIPHATVYALPRDTKAGAGVPQAESDDVGGFDVTLPTGTHVVDVLVLAPGFATSFARMNVEADRVVPIFCDANGGRITIDAAPRVNVTLRHLGAELPAFWVAAKSGGGVDAATGRITSGAIETGRYEACAGTTCRSGYLAPGGELKLSLRD